MIVFLGSDFTIVHLFINNEEFIMTKPYFFNTAKGNDKVQITPLFTKRQKTFSTGTESDDQFYSEAHASILFSY